MGDGRGGGNRRRVRVDRDRVVRSIRQTCCDHDQGMPIKKEGEEGGGGGGGYYIQYHSRYSVNGNRYFQGLFTACHGFFFFFYGICDILS